MTSFTPDTDVLSHSTAQIEALVYQQKRFFATGITRNYIFRKGQLGTLKKAILRYESAFIAAFKKDLGKCNFEGYTTEIGPALKEITYFEKRLWWLMQPKRKATPLLFFPSSSKIIWEPRGVSLIIGPWNYPFFLVISALINSIAAGNTAIVKPSELAPATAAVIKQMLEEIFEPEFVSVITGPGHLLSSQLIEPYQLGIIHFTGSTAVGKAIMKAAAHQLTPVILELGGKSPCIVAEDAVIDYTAKKIIFSKFLNAGQICVAPDYVLVHSSKKAALVEALKRNLTAMYGENPKEHPDYGRIINQKQLQRLKKYLEEGKIVHGGVVNENDLYIAPSILVDIIQDSSIMKEEIFGPILPVLSFDTYQEAKQIINQNPNPLALYIYSNNHATIKEYTEEITFGGGCVNNGLIHLANSNLPFGGIGNSGMGNYHGKEGFKAFSHQKSIMRSVTWLDFPLWYAPYKNWYLPFIKQFMR